MQTTKNAYVTRDVKIQLTEDELSRKNTCNRT